MNLNANNHELACKKKDRLSKQPGCFRIQQAVVVQNVVTSKMNLGGAVPLAFINDGIAQH